MPLFVGTRQFAEAFPNARVVSNPSNSPAYTLFAYSETNETDDARGISYSPLFIGYIKRNDAAARWYFSRYISYMLVRLGHSRAFSSSHYPRRGFCAPHMSVLLTQKRMHRYSYIENSTRCSKRREHLSNDDSQKGQSILRGLKTFFC